VQILGVILILINVGAVVGPIAGVVIAYNGNVQEIVIPSEVQEMVEKTFGAMASPASEPDDSGDSSGPAEVSFSLPQYVSSSYDLATRTVTVILNFTNPLNFTLTVNEVSADVKCHAHGVLLGHAALANPVAIPPSETVDLTVVFAWIETAQDHILGSHADESMINVDLVNIGVSVSGITFETPSTYNLNVPLC
jgi:hypothetical protein